MGLRSSWLDSAAAAWAWVLGASLAAGCAGAADPAGAASPAQHQAFGGERAPFGESGAGQLVTENVGRCQNVPALARDALLDDFEQDSIFLRPVPQRHGTWFMANDGSPDGKQVPESFAAERGGYNGSNYAAHYNVQGFTEWGVVVGFQLRYMPEEGIKCPFNAEAFEGLSFMARGSGRIRVNLGTPETTPSDQEGRCQRGCWDTHGSFVFLTDEWKLHRLPWSSFAQQGWGTASRLNVKELLDVKFSVLAPDQPADVWLDDVQFMTRSAR